jgi:hypothetical protein
VGEKAPYHRGIRGRAALATRPLDVDGPGAEALEPGEVRRVPHGGEPLGAVRVRALVATQPIAARIDTVRRRTVRAAPREESP